MGGKLLTVDEELQIKKFFDANVAPTLAAKQLKCSIDIVQRRYKSLRDSKARKPNIGLDVSRLSQNGGNGEWAKALQPNDDWVHQAVKASIHIDPKTMADFEKKMADLRAENRSLVLRNHELLRALKLIRTAADVEVPF